MNLGIWQLLMQASDNRSSENNIAYGAKAYEKDLLQISVICKTKIRKNTGTRPL